MKIAAILALVGCGFGLLAENFPLLPDKNGLPENWSVYSNTKPRGLAPKGELKVENGVLHIKDLADNCEYGVRRPYKFEAGKYVLKLETSGQCTGAQMVVFDGKKTFAQAFKTGNDPKKWTPVRLNFTTAGGSGFIYIYGTYTGMADFSVRNISVDPQK